MTNRKGIRFCSEQEPTLSSADSPTSLIVLSVLCSKRMPYTPLVDLSLPAVTSGGLSWLATTLLFIAHSTLSFFTEIAISWVTGSPTPAPLFRKTESSCVLGQYTGWVGA